MSLNKFLIRLSATLCISTLCSVNSEAAQLTLKPVNDVYVRLFGGGEGAAAYVKFDISSVPPGQTIDSVFIEGHVWFVAAGWDGDAKFFNVNSQTWQESDSSAILQRIPVSDSTYQAAGFGTAVGWTKSVDVKGIFLSDYGAARAFCSFKVRDIDDMTMVPMPGSFPADGTDSLAVGDRVMTRQILLYPHEYALDTSLIIRLSVYYHQETGVVSSFLENKTRRIDVVPNPFTNNIQIRCETADHGVRMRIYNAAGGMVRCFSPSPSGAGCQGSVEWDGKDDHGSKVPPGVYIYRFEALPDVSIGKLIKSR